MSKLIDVIYDLFFPGRCYVCKSEPDGEEGGSFCRFCRGRYADEKKMLCTVCGKRYADCRCLPQFASPYIERYVSVVPYREDRAAGRLILSAKDASDKRLHGFLADEMVSALKSQDIRPDFVTYIPCAQRSFDRKGFDHGECLAREVAKRMGVPMVCCFRIRGGDEQKTLDAAGRLQNRKDSLKILKKATAKVAGKRALLVDDIMTTGASALVASIHLDEMGVLGTDFVSFGRR